MEEITGEKRKYVGGEVSGRNCKKVYLQQMIIFFPPATCMVQSRRVQRSNIRQKYNRKLQRWQRKWIRGRWKEKCVQETAGEVVTELEKGVMEEKRGRNEEEEKSRAQVETAVDYHFLS